MFSLVQQFSAFGNTMCLMLQFEGHEQENAQFYVQKEISKYFLHYEVKLRSVCIEIYNPFFITLSEVQICQVLNVQIMFSFNHVRTEVWMITSYLSSYRVTVLAKPRFLIFHNSLAKHLLN